LTAIITGLPPLDEMPDVAENRAAWARWQDRLSVRFTWLEELLPLRLLLILDNLAGHKSATFVCWLVVSGRFAANGRTNDTTVSVAQEPSLASLFHING
jgi:hypothetical protein